MGQKYRIGIRIKMAASLIEEGDHCIIKLAISIDNHYS